MDRLPTVLPDWTRIKWVSEEARSVWEGRISRINKAWEKFERSRRNALQFIKHEDYPRIYAEVAVDGKILVPLPEGDPWTGRTAICKPINAGVWKLAWDRRDDEYIGQILGYPECCIKFFKKYWVDEKFVDTTWPMTLNYPWVGCIEYGKYPNLTEIKIQPRVHNNILLRWLGVRLVSHLPCSFDCEATHQMSLVNGCDIFSKDKELYEWIADMLSWPLEWSALHGIAEIKTPILTISTRTDMTEKKYTVQLRGSSYPKEGAKGLVFPFQANA